MQIAVTASIKKFGFKVPVVTARGIEKKTSSKTVTFTRHGLFFQNSYFQEFLAAIG